MPNNQSIYRNFLNTKDLVTQEGILEVVGKDYGEITNGQNSSNSISFKNLATIADYFKIPNRKLFFEKGKKTDCQLHSSALLALLFFYNLKNNELLIGGIKINIQEVYFEVSTIVFPGGPSQMDVVLKGLDEKDNKIIICLESKFTEYLNGITYKPRDKSGNYKEIIKEYFFEDYTDRITQDLFNFKEGEDRNSIELVYGEGVKQLIAHTVGLSNGPTSKSEESKEVFNNVQKIYLGEIVYDFGKKIDKDKNGLSRLDKYRKYMISCTQKLGNSGIKD